MAEKLCVLQQFTAEILAVGNAQTAAVIPGNHDAADVIHASHSALCADRWCLRVIHLNKLHKAVGRVFLTDALDCFFTGKSHDQHLHS